MEHIRNIYNFIAAIAFAYWGISLVSIISIKDISKLLQSPVDVINLATAILGLVFIIISLIHYISTRKEVRRGLLVRKELDLLKKEQEKLNILKKAQDMGIDIEVVTKMSKDEINRVIRITKKLKANEEN